MPQRLLDRQTRLLDYLTDPAVIDGSASAPRGALRGIPAGLLRLEARFSHDKRLEKITASFPRTFALLGPRGAAIVRGFAAACPPASILRIDNVREFHAFLQRAWHGRRVRPAHLRDVAACERACAEIRSLADDAPAAPATVAAPGVRRRPDVALLRCAYDIRAVFEAGAGSPAPRRRTWLAIATRDGAPHVHEVPRAVFDLLDGLGQPIPREAFGDSPAARQLLGDLAERGLIEINP
jgi:hypothetical protein